MAIGPGEYNDVTRQLLEELRARAAIVIIIDGVRGSGVSVQAPIDVLRILPDMLEFMAQEIRAAAAQLHDSLHGDQQ